MSKQQVNEASAKYIVQKKKSAQSDAVESLITQHLDLWASAIASKNATGRGSNKKIELYGVKKLRELILELAVRGKLVPQDPNDEPATVFLKELKTRRDFLAKEKKIRKPKKLPNLEEDEIPHSLPSSWAWARLGDLCEKLTDGSHNPPANAGDGFPMLSSQNVNFDRIDFDNPSRFVTKDDEMNTSRAYRRQCAIIECTRNNKPTRGVRYAGYSNCN